MLDSNDWNRESVMDYVIDHDRKEDEAKGVWPLYRPREFYLKRFGFNASNLLWTFGDYREFCKQLYLRVRFRYPFPLLIERVLAMCGEAGVEAEHLTPQKFEAARKVSNVDLPSARLLEKAYGMNSNVLGRIAASRSATANFAMYVALSRRLGKSPTVTEARSYGIDYALLKSTFGSMNVLRFARNTFIPIAAENESAHDIENGKIERNENKRRWREKHEMDGTVRKSPIRR